MLYLGKLHITAFCNANMTMCAYDANYNIFLSQNTLLDLMGKAAVFPIKIYKATFHPVEC